MPFELILPKILDEPSFESFLGRSEVIVRPQQTLILEMGAVESIDPYGLLGLLELGRHLKLRGHRMLLHQPLSAGLQRHLEQAGFFAQARAIYTVYPPYRKSVHLSEKKDDGYLLEITPISITEDITRAVERLKEKMEEPAEAVIKSVSALLTGIVERGGAGGYAAVRSDSSAIMIAASDRAALRPGGLAKVTAIVLPRKT